MHEIPSFSILKKLYKKKSLKIGKSIKLAILSDFASQLLNVAIQGMAEALEVDLEVYEADFGQIEMQIQNPESELYEFEPDWVLIFSNNNSLKNSFYKSKNPTAFGEEYLASIEEYYDLIQSRLGAKCLFANYYNEKDMVFGSFGYKVPESYAFQLSKINAGITDFIANKGNGYLLDIASLVSFVGQKDALDPRMLVNASLPFHIDFLATISYDVVKLIYNLSGKFAKCLILDLDNTMWGGIIGDDGLEQIQIGDIGIGKAFKQLQIWAKALKERGVIIAVCSKNEEDAAMEPFEKHPEMVLRMEDISVFVANWKTKVENIKYIQEVLNIGFDSIVFLDDNPMERDIVRQHIKDITVPDLPEDPSEYIPYLEHLNLFSTVNYSSNDKDRTSQYQDEAKRLKQKNSFANIDDYLYSLEMEAVIKPFDEFYKPRIAQLTQRSNQFNPRTIRYSEEYLDKLMGDLQYETRYFLLKDKFGEYGLISNIILKKEDDSLFIENWVMSCRVLKRKVEQVVINEVIKIAKYLNLSKVRAEYIATPKNKLVKDLYREMGFDEVTENKYEIEVSSYIHQEHQIKID